MIVFDGAGGHPEGGPNIEGTLEQPGAWEDVLSGLPGPAFWHAIVPTESARARRYRRPVTVVLVEIQGLAKLADEWGEDVAGQAVAAIARIVRRESRSSDYVARVGVDRLGLLLPETDEVAAINFVERVREPCERELRGAPEGVRVAFGWASPAGNTTLLDAVAEAEARLREDPGG